MSIRSMYEKRINDAFRNLLELKHLYQNVNVDLIVNLPEGTIEPLQVNRPRRITDHEEWITYSENNWILIDPIIPKTDQSLFFNLPNNNTFLPPDIKSFCSICKRIEPFNFISGHDFLTRGKSINEITKHNSNIVQTFVLSYLCQSCKKVPEIFIIRREGAKLILSGRAPIEHIEVPNIIPKSVAQFFSSAVVAHQSGHTLSANFLLRTILEQFAKTKAQNPKDADDAINQYMDSLPDDFKERFPSFRDIYSTLSFDIHNAIGSPDVYEGSLAKIIKHFDARKIFEL